MVPAYAYEAVRLDRSARDALAQLGDAMRTSGLDDWRSSLTSAASDTLVACGLAKLEGSEIALVTTIESFGGVLVAIPNEGWGPDAMFLGPDAAYLVEAARRLAPEGERAVDLGTGTGVVAATIAATHRVVAGTDVSASVVLAAAVTMALNDLGHAHTTRLCVTDVAGGLRLGAFDLVVANPPWVPLAADSAAQGELYSCGGETGAELPRRFLHEGAALLRPGGVAITLALDSLLDDGQRPLRDARPELEDRGFVTAIVPTPWSLHRRDFVERIRARQPSIVDAEHVAVVVARPPAPGDTCRPLFSRVEQLRTDWAS